MDNEVYIAKLSVFCRRDICCLLTGRGIMAIVGDALIYELVPEENAIYLYESDYPNLLNSWEDASMARLYFALLIRAASDKSCREPALAEGFTAESLDEIRKYAGTWFDKRYFSIGESCKEKISLIKKDMTYEIGIMLDGMYYKLWSTDQINEAAKVFIDELTYYIYLRKNLAAYEQVFKENLTDTKIAKIFLAQDEKLYDRG